MESYSSIIKKIEKLREKYRKCKNPVDKTIIAARGKLLKRVLEKRKQY